MKSSFATLNLIKIAILIFIENENKIILINLYKAHAKYKIVNRKYSKLTLISPC